MVVSMTVNYRVTQVKHLKNYKEPFHYKLNKQTRINIIVTRLSQCAKSPVKQSEGVRFMLIRHSNHSAILSKILIIIAK